MKPYNIEEVKTNFPKDAFELIYMDYSKTKEEIRNQLGVSSSKLDFIANLYNLKRDNRLMLERRKDSFGDTLNRISKEDLIKYYIDEDHEYEETAEYFHIKCSMLDKIKLYYGVKKDFSKTASKNINKKYI